MNRYREKATQCQWLLACYLYLLHDTHVVVHHSEHDVLILMMQGYISTHLTISTKQSKDLALLDTE